MNFDYEKWFGRENPTECFSSVKEIKKYFSWGNLFFMFGTEAEEISDDERLYAMKKTIEIWKNEKEVNNG